MTWLEPQALRLLTLGCGVFLLERWPVSLLKCTSWVWTTKGKLGLWQDLPFLMDPFLVCLNFCGRNFMLQKTLGWGHYQKEKIKFYFLFFEKRIYFGSFKYPEVRETKYKNHQIRILGFLLCSQKYRSWLWNLCFIYRL
jgi:hypothetical protein